MDDTNFMEVNKAAFDSFVGEYKTESVKTIISFYRTCLLFRTLSDQKKVELSAKSFMIKYPTNTLIIRQNDIPYNMYFIASGGARLVRRISLEQKEMITLDSKREVTEIEDSIGRPPPSGALFQVGLLKEGDSFADWELFNNKAIVDSVITTMPSLVIYVPYFWVVERIGTLDLSRIKEASKGKISNEEILLSFAENAQWNDFKKGIVQHFLFEKQNRLERAGRNPRTNHLKVNIDKKSKAMGALVKPPGLVGVRSVKPFNSSASSTHLPPIKKSPLHRF